MSRPSRIAQLRLRTVLIVIAAMCVYVAHMANQASIERRASEAIAKLDGRVGYDWYDMTKIQEFGLGPDFAGHSLTDSTSHQNVSQVIGTRPTSFFRRHAETVLGSEYFQHIVSATVPRLNASPIDIPPSLLDTLGRLPKLSHLTLHLTELNYNHLVSLGKFQALESLTIVGATVEEDILRSANSLGELRTLQFASTCKLSANLAERLQACLPDCNVMCSSE